MEELLYSCYYIKDVLKQKRTNGILLLVYDKHREAAFTEDECHWQLSFYEACGLFKDVEMIEYDRICDFREEHTKKLLCSKQFYDLDLHRAFPIDFEKIDKREWQYSILPKHFTKHFEEPLFADKIEADSRTMGKTIVSFADSRH